MFVQKLSPNVQTTRSLTSQEVIDAVKQTSSHNQNVLNMISSLVSKFI